MKAERAETISWQCFGWQRSITPPLPYSSRAPKRVKMPNGSDTAVIDNGKPNTIGITRSVRIAHADLAKQVPTFETCAGIGTPEQRLAEQDRRPSIARGLRIENSLPMIAMTKGAAHVG